MLKTDDARDEQLLSFDRRKRILEIVNQKKSVTIDSLAEVLPVSRMTVSRDLERLENDGLLKRVRGGAVSLAHIVVAPPMSRSAQALTDDADMLIAMKELSSSLF